MTNINVRKTSRGYELVFEYDPQIIHMLKSIPSAYRSYDPRGRIWIIKDNFTLEGFVKEAESRGHRVRTLAEPKSEGYSSARSDNPFVDPQEAYRKRNGQTRANSGSSYSFRWAYEEPPPRTPPRPMPTASAPWADALFSGLPAHLHDKVYRAMAKVLHPDAGGDAEAMKALNAARDKAKR